MIAPINAAINDEAAPEDDADVAFHRAWRAVARIRALSTAAGGVVVGSLLYCLLPYCLPDSRRALQKSFNRRAVQSFSSNEQPELPKGRSCCLLHWIL